MNAGAPRLRLARKAYESTQAVERMSDVAGRAATRASTRFGPDAQRHPSQTVPIGLPSCHSVSFAHVLEDQPAAGEGTINEMDDSGTVRMVCREEAPLRQLLLRRKEHFPTKLAYRKAIARGRVRVNDTVVKDREHRCFPEDVVAYRVTSYIVAPDPEANKAPESSMMVTKSGTVFDVLDAAGLTHTTANRIIKAGSVCIDGTQATSRVQRVRVGQKVTWSTTEKQVHAFVSCMEVVSENQHFAVVVKPAGVKMDATGGKFTRQTFRSMMIHALQPTDVSSALPNPVACHRLDAPVGGLVVCAKTELAVTCISAAFADRLVAKRYRALVVGAPEPADGEWKQEIDGKSAHTNYRTLRSTPSLRFGRVSLTPPMI